MRIITLHDVDLDYITTGGSCVCPLCQHQRAQIRAAVYNATDTWTRDRRNGPRPARWH